MIVEETEVIKEEPARIRAHVKAQQSVCVWLPEAAQNEIHLLLGDGIAKERLVTSYIIAAFWC